MNTLSSTNCCRQSSAKPALLVTHVSSAKIVHSATMCECARLSLHHTHGMHAQPAMYVYYVILTFITFYIYTKSFQLRH